MTENSSQQSATIYQFPVQARRTDGSRQEPSTPQLAAHSAVAGGSGWYHDAAIEEAKHARDH